MWLARGRTAQPKRITEIPGSTSPVKLTRRLILFALWEAAIGALDAGELPSPGGERRMLRLAASLADQAPVSLGEAITGIDDRNVGLLVKAVLHASGRRQFQR